MKHSTAKKIRSNRLYKSLTHSKHTCLSEERDCYCLCYKKYWNDAQTKSRSERRLPDKHAKHEDEEVPPVIGLYVPGKEDCGLVKRGLEQTVNRVMGKKKFT